MRQEVDIRYVVTSLKGTAQHLYEDVYCQRGQMENLIKLHKAQLASRCEFATLRERLIKIGARVIEHIARIRVQLPTSCPEGALFRAVALGLMPSACQSASLNADGAAVAIDARCCAEYRNPKCDDTIMAPTPATHRHWPPRRPSARSAISPTPLSPRASRRQTHNAGRPHRTFHDRRRLSANERRRVLRSCVEIGWPFGPRPGSAA
jgi:hypothetical protein